jgi:hypothetical protein
MKKNILLVIIALTSISANAVSDYDVNWISHTSTSHTLEITIDDCITNFTVKDKELALINNDYLDEALNIAIKRSQQGCK